MKIERLQKGKLSLTNLETGEPEPIEAYYPQEMGEKINELVDWINAHKDQLL